MLRRDDKVCKYAYGLNLVTEDFFGAAIVHESEDTAYDSQYPEYNTNEFCRIHIIKTLLTTATTADPIPTIMKLIMPLNNARITKTTVMKIFIPLS